MKSSIEKIVLIEDGQPNEARALIDHDGFKA
jgi:hypothetical protein